MILAVSHMKNKFHYILDACFIFSFLLFLLYFNNLSLVDRKTRNYYYVLKDSLTKKGYQPRLLVVCTKRIQLHNKFQVMAAGAAQNSRHLKGNAIDFIVFDINDDGTSDARDVDIVYQLLDRKIVRNTGGIGTYKNEVSVFYRQMIHIDSRGYKARW